MTLIDEPGRRRRPQGDAQSGGRVAADYPGRHARRFERGPHAFEPPKVLDVDNVFIIRDRAVELPNKSGIASRSPSQDRSAAADGPQSNAPVPVAFWVLWFTAGALMGALCVACAIRHKYALAVIAGGVAIAYGTAFFVWHSGITGNLKGWWQRSRKSRLLLQEEYSGFVVQVTGDRVVVVYETDDDEITHEYEVAQFEGGVPPRVGQRVVTRASVSAETSRTPRYQRREEEDDVPGRPIRGHPEF